MPYTEELLCEALEAIQGGKSVRLASQEYQIPRGTLRMRLAGSISRKERDSHQKLLSDYQEKILANWIEVQHALGHPPSHNAIRLAAGTFLKAAGSTATPGERWPTKFLARHPHLGTLRGKQHDFQRSKGVQPDRIKTLFDALNHPHVRTIRPQHRWNFDETGIAEGSGGNRNFIRPVKDSSGQKRRFALVKSNNTRTWVTIIEAVSAEGNYLPPVVIFKGGSVQAQWFPVKVDEFNN